MLSREPSQLEERLRAYRGVSGRDSIVLQSEISWSDSDPRLLRLPAVISTSLLLSLPAMRVKLQIQTNTNNLLRTATNRLCQQRRVCQ